LIVAETLLVEPDALLVVLEVELLLLEPHAAIATDAATAAPAPIMRLVIKVISFAGDPHVPVDR
jgi:hypothetical protein